MRAIRHFLMLATLLLPAMNTAPAAAAACGGLQIIDSLEMTPLPSGRPAIKVTIADTPRTMLIDTGGAVSSVTQQTVQELGLTQIQNGRGLRGVNGAFTSVLARLPSIAIGRLQQANALYYVLPNSDASGTAEFDGILGGEFFKQYDADLDFTSGKLNLFLQDHCAGQVVYWAPVAAVVPFTLNASNHITFRVELDGKRIQAMLDTGASNTVLNLTDARRTFAVDVSAADVEKVGELTGGYTASIYRRRFKTLAFEGVTIDNPMIVLMPDMMNGTVIATPQTGSLISGDRSGLPSLILGMSTLSRMHVYIAYKERKLYITSASPQGAPAPAPAAQ
jgi:predicted aspartyl protease